jgi:hypothetical protein
VNVPPYNVSPTNPDRNVDWARYTPISGAGSVYYKNKTPYTISANLTIERQLGANMLFSICGPFGEKLVYTRANGTVVNGTRAAYPNSIGTDAVYQRQLQQPANLPQAHRRPAHVPGQLHLQQIDGLGLSIQEQVDPLDFRKE